MLFQSEIAREINHHVYAFLRILYINYIYFCRNYFSTDDENDGAFDYSNDTHNIFAEYVDELFSSTHIMIDARMLSIQYFAGKCETRTSRLGDFSNIFMH